MDNKDKHGVDLTEGSIPRHLITFSIPMLLGSSLQTFYSIVNALWVGRFLGAEAMATVTVGFPVLFVLMSVAIGLTMGASILVSQHYGAKDFDGMRKVVQNGTILTTAASIICLIIGLIFANPLLRFMQTPSNIFEQSVYYFRLTLFTVPFMFGTFLLASTLRGVGDSKTPVYFQGAWLLVTAVLDPILMFGLLGFPKLGLNGTAWANIFSQICCLITLVYYLNKKKHIANPDIHNLKFIKSTSAMILKIGAPSMLQQAMVALGMSVLIGIVNQFGETSTAAAGVAFRIDQIAFMPAMTLGMAVSTLAGQNIGAKKYDRVKQVFWWGLLVSCILTGIGTALAVSFPNIMMSLFIKDPKVIEIGAGYFKICGWSYILFAIMFVSNGVINGSGHTLVTTLITLAALWGVRVPIAIYMSKTTGDIRWVWWAILIGVSVGTIISLSYFFSGKWKNPLRDPITIDLMPEELNPQQND